MKLTKGTFYAAAGEKGLSFGEYIGRMGNRFVFLGSGFCCDNAELNRGIAIEEFPKWSFVELPPDKAKREFEALMYLREKLPA